MTEQYSPQTNTTEAPTGLRPADVAEAVDEPTRILDRTLSALGALPKAQTVEGASETLFIDPGTGGNPNIARCRGFTGEGEEQKEGGLGTGPCIVTTGEEPATGGETPSEEHVIRDPGMHVPEEDPNPHAGGGCIQYTGEESPEPANALPEGDDGTVIAMNAILRTMQM